MRVNSALVLILFLKVIVLFPKIEEVKAQENWLAQ
jgi:hypothetical protein